MQIAFVPMNVTKGGQTLMKTAYSHIILHNFVQPTQTKYQVNWYFFCSCVYIYGGLVCKCMNSMCFFV